jgi:hypothetical protein
MPSLVVRQGGNILDRPSLASDGRSLYFGIRSTPNLGRWDAGNPDSVAAVLQVSPGPTFSALASPVGPWLAITVTQDGTSEIFLRSTDPAQTQRITLWELTGYGGKQWSRDGRELFVASNDSMYAIPLGTGATLSPGAPRALFRMGRLLPRSFDVMDDGHFVMIRQLDRLDDPPQLILIEDWKELVKP